MGRTHGSINEIVTLLIFGIAHSLQMNELLYIILEADMNFRDQKIPFNKLTKAQKELLRKEGVFNGFWWAWTNPIIKFLIEKICRHFKEANADKHDYWFYIGWDIKRFHECNDKFLLAIQKDSLRLSGFTKYKFLFIAFLAYTAIELFWKKYFYFTNK